MVYWATQKEGFFVDEMFTLMDIRGGGLDRPYREEGFFDNWHEGVELKSTVGVSKENVFSYNGPRLGVWGTLYFNILHTAYSFVPDTFIIWPAIIINILFYIGTLILLYLLSKILINDKYLAMLPCLLWGISSAAIDLVVFIRHYTMFTFFCVLLTYIAFRVILKESQKWYDWVVLTVIGTFGFLTHQYFPLYAFFLTTFICLYLLLIKKIKCMFLYSASMASTLVLYMLHFQIQNNAYLPLFENRRGLEAIENLTNNINFSNNIHIYIEYIRGFVSANINIIILIATVLLMILIIFLTQNRSKKLREVLSKQENVLWLILFGTSASYFLIIARIAPILPYSYRYIANITPFLMLLFIAVLLRFLWCFKLSIYLKSSVIATPIILLLIFNTNVPFLYIGSADHDKKLELYYDVPVVCTVLEESTPFVLTTYWHLFNFRNQVLFTLGNKPDIDTINKKPLNDGLLLVIQYWFITEPVEDIIARYIDATGLNEAIYVSKSERHMVYYLKP